jgi:hypothetical protein
LGRRGENKEGGVKEEGRVGDTQFICHRINEVAESQHQTPDTQTSDIQRKTCNPLLTLLIVSYNGGYKGQRRQEGDRGGCLSICLSDSLVLMEKRNRFPPPP